MTAIWVETPNKTALLAELVLPVALDPFIRRIAVALVQSADRLDHPERISRLHRWVTTGPDYHRELVELFHTSAEIASQGGDCDDLCLLLAALAWSLRYPWRMVAVGGTEESPGHYQVAIGYPPADDVWGEPGTRWLLCDPSDERLAVRSTHV